jgi:hypothetical protein
MFLPRMGCKEGSEDGYRECPSLSSPITILPCSVHLLILILFFYRATTPLPRNWATQTRRWILRFAWPMVKGARGTRAKRPSGIARRSSKGRAMWGWRGFTRTSTSNVLGCWRGSYLFAYLVTIHILIPMIQSIHSFHLR